jgi:hypothetical protein
MYALTQRGIPQVKIGDVWYRMLWGLFQAGFTLTRVRGTPHGFLCTNSDGIDAKRIISHVTPHTNEGLIRI